MKQQQSGIIEAKAAIRRADETVLQGRSIVVFTVVTIFFVGRRYPHSVAAKEANATLTKSFRSRFLLPFSA